MRRYTLTLDSMRNATDNERDRVAEWCKLEGSPSLNTIVKIDLYPSLHKAVYHLAASVEVGDDGQPCIKTMEFPMPIRNAPRWVDMCSMSEV